MNAISAALTLWQAGFASDDQIIDWAYSEILKSDVPAQAIIDLSLEGPVACLRQAEYVFPFRPMRLGFQDEFSLRFVFTDFLSDQDTLQFVDWASRHCIGEDLSNEIVRLSYQFDHLVCDCNDEQAAIAHARNNIPLMGMYCTADVALLLEQVPNLVLNRKRRNGIAHP